MAARTDSSNWLIADDILSSYWKDAHLRSHPAVAMLNQADDQGLTTSRGLYHFCAVMYRLGGWATICIYLGVKMSCLEVLPISIR